MTKDDFLHTKPKMTWQLVLQFASPYGQTGGCQAAERITQAVRGLGLQPVAAGRAEKAVLDALQKEAQRQGAGQNTPAISVRVWLGTRTGGDTRRLDLKDPKVHSQEGSGWGFFLLERHEESLRGTVTELARVIELCLYQEGTLIPQGMRPAVPDAKQDRLPLVGEEYEDRGSIEDGKTGDGKARSTG